MSVDRSCRHRNCRPSAAASTIRASHRAYSESASGSRACSTSVSSSPGAWPHHRLRKHPVEYERELSGELLPEEREYFDDPPAQRLPATRDLCYSKAPQASLTATARPLPARGSRTRSRRPSPPPAGRCTTEIRRRGSPAHGRRQRRGTRDVGFPRPASSTRPVAAPRCLVAGFSVAGIPVPQSTAYAQLAGQPPVQGLYAAASAPILAAFAGSSRICRLARRR